MSLFHSVTGQGNKTLVFLHQANGSMQLWEQQINDTAFQNYTRICIELPGHGRSSRADNYSIPEMGRILAEKINTLQLQEYVIVTMSLSTAIAAEALPGITGCKGLFMTGCSLIGGNITPLTLMLPFEHGGVLFEADPANDHLHAYLQGLVSGQDEKLIASMAAEFRHTDPAFRTGLAASLGQGIWNDQITILRQAAIPLGFAFGEEERIINLQYLNDAPLVKWKNSVQLIKKAGHLANLDQPALYNSMLVEFLETIWA